MIEFDLAYLGILAGGDSFHSNNVWRSSTDS